MPRSRLAGLSRMVHVVAVNPWATRVYLRVATPLIRLALATMIVRIQSAKFPDGCIIQIFLVKTNYQNMLSPGFEPMNSLLFAHVSTYHCASPMSYYAGLSFG